jgi:hypothetical protein
MAELLDDTWHRRERPFLLEAARRLEATPRDPIWGHEIAHSLQMTDTDAAACLARLGAAGYVELLNVDQFVGITNISEDAAREVGLWPTADVAADRLIAALEAAIKRTDEPEQKTRLQKIRDGFAGAGRDVAVSIAGAVITGQIT